MKEILFKAKQKDNEKWIEGYYAKAKDYLTDEDVHVIFPVDLTLLPHSEFSSYVEIIPETLCRLIEHPCYDGNCTDQRFFEGDIIEVYKRHRNLGLPHEPDMFAIVVNESCITENGLGRWFPQDTTQVKVVGNIWDNPELVGEKYANLYRYYNGYSYDRPNLG